MVKYLEEHPHPPPPLHPHPPTKKISYFYHQVNSLYEVLILNT